ncbi:MAG: PfkB family carbohydrate kinase [Candidatus Nezhaarchaeales archaeon]
MSKSYDLAIVGHITLDLISRKGSRHPFFVIGGPPVYGGLAARRLGATVILISKVGPDFGDERMLWLSRAGLDTSLIKLSKTPTTRFDISYKDGNRYLRLLHRCSPITSKDIPRNLKPKALHVGAVAGEVSKSAFKLLKKLVCIKSIDLQGVLRAFTDNGYITLRGSKLTERVLSMFDVVCGSLEEHQALLGPPLDLYSLLKRLGNRIVIITVGSKGSFVKAEGYVYSIPAYEDVKIVDPTGAGDTYLASFLYTYSLGEEVAWSASIATAAASFVVEGVGPSCFGTLSMVEERARKIYERVERRKITKPHERSCESLL